MANQKSQQSVAFAAIMALALMAAGCTKSRDAALPDTEALQTFAISEFGAPTDAGFQAKMKASAKLSSTDQVSNKALQEKGMIAFDVKNSSIPDRLKFMFKELEVSGQGIQNYKIVFGVDAKFVTAYKAVSDVESLSILEKQLAVSAKEVQFAIEMQKSENDSLKKTLALKMLNEQKVRSTALANRSAVNILVPLFKYQIITKGVLERTKNELKESTSTLQLRETEFNSATHIKIATSSEERKNIGSFEQKTALDQLYTTESLDNKITSAGELKSKIKIAMDFVSNNSQVLTKLDANDLKVYELTTLDKLTEKEQRLVKTNRGNSEVLQCSDITASSSKDKNCVLRLVAKVPVTYKNVSLNLADSNENTSNTLELEKVSKADSKGLVEITQNISAERTSPTGSIDPVRTIKISEIKGNEFYFRRTFESSSNMMVFGKTGTSGDMSIVSFELEDSRLVVRNQKALIKYIGQGPMDKEELMSVPVKYFALDTKDASGTLLTVPQLRQTTKEEAEYLEIDWTQNTIPVSNSPLAYFGEGSCFAAQTSSQVTDMDMRLSKEGMLNFSLASSYSVRPECANEDEVSQNAQFNYNIVERLSFKKRTDKNEDVQFATDIPLTAQSALNFAAFTIADQVAISNGLGESKVRAGREGSIASHPVIHDFRGGKVLHYWVGGLTNSAPERRALIEESAKEVVAEWNEALHKAFSGSELDRSSDYIVLHIEDDSNRGHLGDLDKNYLWFMDMPAKNGLLGVAQFAPNPHSGTIIANNVIVYSGNTAEEVNALKASYEESRKYEKLLDEAKSLALSEFQKNMAEEQKDLSKGVKLDQNVKDPAEKARAISGAQNVFVKKLLLSAKAPVIERLTSKYSGSLVKLSAKPGQLRRKSVVQALSEKTIESNKVYTRRIVEQALSEDLKDDPMMLEAIIAKEMARNEVGLSPAIRALLLQQASKNEMAAKFEKSAKQRGGCYLYSRNEYNDKFVQADFATLFKKEIKSTLLHEVGHAIGLRHNFKGSYDKKNFNFAGEKNNRNYTSIMDYIAAAEMEYQGPGTYDVHALRAIYTNRLEVSDTLLAKIGSKGGNFNTQVSKSPIHVSNDHFVRLSDIKNMFGISSWAELQKGSVDASGLLKHYAQCHDELVGIEPACQRYDQGASATEIVKNEIQNYHRSYATSYRASDRLRFGQQQKVRVIRSTIEKFGNIRNYLDQALMMEFQGTAHDETELADFDQAAKEGYKFFHEVIRTPETNLPFGKTPDEQKRRLVAIPYASADGKTKVKFLEARNMFDQVPSPGGDRIDTLGIGYDKQFALDFLLTATRGQVADESQDGWFSYLEYEKYSQGAKDKKTSLIMTTLLDIMMNNLRVGFFDENSDFRLAGQLLDGNRGMLDGAMLGAILDTERVKMMSSDPYSELFKVGTLKGGKKIKDRFTVTRSGHKENSETGIRFFAIDNADAASVLVREAARGAIMTDKTNHEAVMNLLFTIVKGDGLAVGQAEMLKASNDKLKDKSTAEVIASVDELKNASSDAEIAAKDLQALLVKLNESGVLASAEEIKANPNLAIDKQVYMTRSLISSTVVAMFKLAPLMKNMTIAEGYANLYKFMNLNQDFQELARVPMIGMAQEIILILGQKIQYEFKDGKVNAMQMLLPAFGDNIVEKNQNRLMAVLEQLAKYTSVLNPEYVY